MDGKRNFLNFLAIMLRRLFRHFLSEKPKNLNQSEKTQKDMVGPPSAGLFAPVQLW